MANIRQRLLASSALLLGLGLCSPIYKQIYKQSLQNFQEHFFPRSKVDKVLTYRPCYRHLSSRSSSRSSFQKNSQTGIAISPDRQELYRLTDNGIQITNKHTGHLENFPLPYSFPQLSWGTDITYDSKRDLVSLVSFGGEGYFYRFDVKQRRWLDVRSLNNLDLKSITYDRITDRYVAWAEDYGMNRGNLLFFSGTGILLSQENISDRMAGFHRLSDRGYAMQSPVEIFARGNNLALMIYKGNSVQYIWHYDLDSKNVRLTYKSPAQSNILYSD